MARNPASHKTKVQYSPELEGLICGTITMPYIENKVVSTSGRVSMQTFRTPLKRASSMWHSQQKQTVPLPPA